MVNRLYVLLVPLWFIACGPARFAEPLHLEVDRLNTEAFDVRYRDFVVAKSRAFEALALAEVASPPYYKGMAQAWNSIAYTNYLTSYFDSTRYYLEKVRGIGVDYPDKEIENTITHITEARLYLRECRYAEAFVVYDSMLSIFNDRWGRLSYNPRVPLKKHDRDRYNWAKSDYLLGNAVLGYYYRDADLPVVLSSLDRIEKDASLHIDTTQLSILYYTYAGTYERAIAADVGNFYLAVENVRKGLDLLADPSTRNDYYLANFYQMTGALLLNRGLKEWMAGPDSVGIKREIEELKQDYLAAKYGWEYHDLESPYLPLLLLARADMIFREYDDPYQLLASSVHIANYHMREQDTLWAEKFYHRAIESDSVIKARHGSARIWTRHLYNTLLVNFMGSVPTGEARRWFDIYSEESAIIAENTRRDYAAQKGKAEAEAVARRSMLFVLFVLTVCVTALVLLYFLVGQNRKLKKARTALNLRNEELDMQYRELSFMQKKLIEQKRMELLTYVVRGISHELSQPLGTITQTLYDSVSDVDRLAGGREKLTEEEYGRIVGNLASDLVTIGRGKDTIADLVNSFRNTIRENIMDPKQKFGLAARLEDIVKVVRPTIKSNISLTVECDPDVVVYSFPLLFSQVVTNLISNANQHAFPDSSDAGDAISIVCRVVGCDLVMQCRDNGIGIPEEELDRLCQPFVSKKQANLGLGLSLVKNIVEQYMEGEISFASEGGLLVTVVMPGCVVEDGGVMDHE